MSSQRTSNAFGVVIAHSPAVTQQYIGSPSLAILPGGDYLATHDRFGPGSGADKLGAVSVYRSSDRGKSWHHLRDVEGLYWASLFVHNEDVYLMGTDRGDGRIAIGRSGDDGVTWKTATLSEEAKFHGAPVPVMVHGGKLWRAIEDGRGPGGWGPQFRAMVMSADVDADLLDPRSWKRSQPLQSSTSWLQGHFGGWLEGNVVVAPDGTLVILMRVDYRLGDIEKAAIIHLSDDGETLSFDPERDLIDLPGGCKKFTIRHDPVTGLYWSLTNHVPRQHLGGNAERTRNTVTLICSRDLVTWELRDTVLYHPDVSRHGFCYLDWQFEGDDLIAVARTAADDDEGGARSQHDANYLTFHRFERFCERTGAEI